MGEQPMELMELMEALLHSGPITPISGGFCGGGQVIWYVAAVSTASSAWARHMCLPRLAGGSGALQDALQEALRELQGVPRPPPLCCCHTPGDDAPTPNTLCPGPDRGARVCDPQVSATLSPGMGAIISGSGGGRCCRRLCMPIQTIWGS